MFTKFLRMLHFGVARSSSGGVVSETRKQLSDVQSRLTVNEQVTEATQRRQLIQEGAYENLPKNSVYEKLRFDPSQEHDYTKLQPTHIGCSNVLLVHRLQ